MSRANVELVRRAVDAVNRRDLDGLLAVMDRDVEAVSRLVAIEGGYHGHDGIRRWWGNIFDAFPDYSIEVVDLRDLGDLVLAAVRMHAHGAGSEIPVAQALWLVTECRDKKVVWWSAYEAEGEALEAVGLRQ